MPVISAVGIERVVTAPENDPERDAGVVKEPRQGPQVSGERDFGMDLQVMDIDVEMQKRRFNAVRLQRLYPFNQGRYRDAWIRLDIAEFRRRARRLSLLAGFDRRDIGRGSLRDFVYRQRARTAAADQRLVHRDDL